MDYNNNQHDSDLARQRALNKVETKKSGIGIGVVVAIVLAIVAAVFFFNNNGVDDTARVGAGADRASESISQSAETAGDKVKDVAAEVPQALDDATTDGDQKTTRPNDDGSKDKLDQK